MTTCAHYLPTISSKNKFNGNTITGKLCYNLLSFNRGHAIRKNLLTKFDGNTITGKLCDNLLSFDHGHAIRKNLLSIKVRHFLCDLFQKS